MTDQEDEHRISGEEARQGDIILRSRWQRIVFIIGLAGLVVVAILAVAG